MTNEHVSLPAPNVREYANEMALQLVRDKLSHIGNMAEQCRRCEADYVAPEHTAIIEHLGRPYRVNLASGKVTLLPEGEEAPMRERILVLHYLTQAKGSPLTGKLITYKELADGINYFPVFHKRAIQPVVTFFGGEPARLVETATALGGTKTGYGDAAVTISAFKRVPLTFVLWQGDAELAPEGNIMFDSTIADYLTNDDIHVLCETIAWKLVRLLKTGGENSGN